MPLPFLLYAGLLLLAGIAPVAAQVVPEGRAQELRASYRRPATIPFPQDNPYTAPKAALGKLLFFDPRLSGRENMSCATCHNPSFGWEVPLAGAVGSQNTVLARNAPTVLDHAWSTSLFWDGRAASLEEQARGPIEAAVEMDLPLPRLVERLAGIEGYRRLFEAVFPGEGVSERNILRAIATYERTVVSGTSAFDRWVEGDDAALSPAAQRGLLLFEGTARCSLCHKGWLMTDGLFHDIGMPDEDIGRGQLEPDNPLAQQAFKTPSLRDIPNRAPYMHDGSLPDLATVLVHYVAGGVDRPSRSPLIRPLDLSEQDLADLEAFLESLRVAPVSIPLPVLPH